MNQCLRNALGTKTSEPSANYINSQIFFQNRKALIQKRRLRGKTELTPKKLKETVNDDGKKLRSDVPNSTRTPTIANLSERN
jgi:hypothetical protein